MSLIDPAFEAWLQASGADRDWIRRNLPALRERYARDTSPLVVPAAPVTKACDRYEEL